MTLKEQFNLKKLIGFKFKKFKLLWRGTRNGFAAFTFHDNCDGKPNTLTVIKNTEGYIFGGYKSKHWISVKDRRIDLSGFLFTLSNPTNTPLKLYKYKDNYILTHKRVFKSYGCSKCSKCQRRSQQ